MAASADVWVSWGFRMFEEGEENNITERSPLIIQWWVVEEKTQKKKKKKTRRAYPPKSNHLALIVGSWCCPSSILDAKLISIGLSG